MRKKFTMLLASMFLCVGAWAQVTSLADFKQDKCYTFATSSRGGWAVNADGTQFGSTNDFGFGTTVDATNSQHQFAVLSANGEDYYLYSVSAKKFIKKDRTLFEGPADALAIADASSVGEGRVQFRFRDIAESYINLGGSNQMTIDWWGTIDAGNAVLVSEAGDFNAAEALAMLSNVWTVTYNFTYDGEVKFTQTTEVVKGTAYPDYTVVLPGCVVAAAKPEGTVDANKTVEVALSVNLPFTVSTLTDGEFGEDMYWYYLTMRSKDVTYDAATGMALTGNVEEKSAYNYFAFTGNPFDGFNIYNYVAGSDKVFWRADATDGGRVYFTNTAETDGNTWMLSANGTSGYVFRLNGYENGYMNDHRPQIAIWQSTWGATDEGSTFQFVFVEEPDLTVLYDITYEYVYGEDVKATQTITVESGAEYPACSYFAPYGVTVGAKPEGAVNASGTHQIELTIDKELPFETAIDASNINTWYYAQMHMNSKVTSYIQDNNDGIVEWADKEFAVDEIDSHLWGFVGNVWDGIKVINKGTGNAIISTSGSAVTGNAANATAFIPTTSQASNLDCFCLKYPTNNNYLNAQGSAIASWGDNDNGSSFLLTEFMEKTVSISDLDYATLFLDYATYIPEGVEVYAVTEAVNGYATLTAIEGEVLPANTGVILKKTGSYTFKTAGATGTVEGNLLSGTSEDTYVADDAYVLAAKNGVVGLYKAELNKDASGAEGNTHFLNNANKAYLPASAVAEAAPMFSLERGEGSTSIENAQLTIDNVVIYDLTGRRVEKMEKGIYIVNGKKVIK